MTIPPEGSSTAALALNLATSCPVSAPANTNCAQYTLIEPAGNPSVGAFAAGTVPYSTPGASPVLYSIRADAFVPLSGGTTDCTPSAVTTGMDSGGNPLQAVPGPPIKPKETDFSGCS